MEQNLISVIMPVYKTEESNIKACVLSYGDFQWTRSLFKILNK